MGGALDGVALTATTNTNGMPATPVTEIGSTVIRYVAPSVKPPMTILVVGVVSTLVVPTCLCREFPTVICTIVTRYSLISPFGLAGRSQVSSILS